MCLKFKLLVIAILLPVCTSAFAQNVVKGKVVDNNGSPVVGTRITIEATGESVSTDFNGNFEIEAEPGSKIVADCVGMQEKKAVLVDGIVITLTRTTIWNRKPNKYEGLISLQCGSVLNPSKIPSFGLMGGVVKQFGGYAKILLSADMVMGKVAECDVDASTSLFTDGIASDYWTTGKTFTAFCFVSGGLIARLGCPLYGYVGGGYCKLEHGAELCADESGDVHWASVNKISGLALDMGLMFKVGPITVNAGAGLPVGSDIFANFGLGFMF